MESPSKRLKPSPAEERLGNDDFVPLNFEDEGNQEYGNRYGYNDSPPPQSLSMQSSFEASRGPRPGYQRRDPRSDPRHSKDRPKSSHPLPGHEPWLLVKTKYGRHFIHNKETKESLWRVPKDLQAAVRGFEHGQGVEEEKARNAQWAEEQLTAMRAPESGKRDIEVAQGQAADGVMRRRRSVSLQREDEEALMAEMAAEAEKTEEKDAREAFRNVEALRPQSTQVERQGYESDSSYEEVEVTDSEFEDEQDDTEKAIPATTERSAADVGQQQGDGPVEFGEDDIAWQLAAMEEDGDLDPSGSDAEDGDDVEYPDDSSQGDRADEQEATLDFRSMLNDHKISPFTPWDNLLKNESILYDERWTILPNTRTRKVVWEEWVKDTAARLKAERAKAEQQNPRIPYLAFLSEKATPKLYWPEFKRKYRKEAVLNERKLSDKEREKLYRDHIARLKLPERTRKADLVTLLESVPLRMLNRDTTLDALPALILSNLHFISLPASAREPVVRTHVSTLPSAPADGEDAEPDAELQKKREEERRKREKALLEREKKVEEERRKAEKEGRWAKRDAKEAEREVREATLGVGRKGLMGQLSG